MRTIHMVVAGDEAALDSAVAGVQGSGNVDKLVVRFDPSWEGCAKSACWWDAHGVQAGEPRLLTTDMLVDMQDANSGYILLVPPKALAYAGRCSLVIDGWKDGCLARTARQEFQVVAAPLSAKSAEMPADKAQQLQAEIEALLGNMAALAHSEHAQAAARVRFLQSVWETGERAWGYVSGYAPAEDGSGETIWYLPVDDAPIGGPRWRKHPIEGGEYQVSVTRGEKTTVQSVYYVDVPILVDGVTIWGDREPWPLPGVDALKIEYVRCMEDQAYVPKAHLEQLCADASTARDEASTARSMAQTAQNAAEKARDGAGEYARQAQAAQGAAAGAQSLAGACAQLAQSSKESASQTEGRVAAMLDMVKAFAEKAEGHAAVVRGSRIWRTSGLPDSQMGEKPDWAIDPDTGALYCADGRVPAPPDESREAAWSEFINAAWEYAQNWDPVAMDAIFPLDPTDESGARRLNLELLNDRFMLRKSLDGALFGSVAEFFDCSWGDMLYNVITMFFMSSRVGDFSGDDFTFDKAIPTMEEFQYVILHYDEIMAAGNILPSLEVIRSEAQEKYTWRKVRGWELVGNLKGPRGSRIWRTSGLPDIQLGEKQDWAIDPDTGALYYADGRAPAPLDESKVTWSDFMSAAWEYAMNWDNGPIDNILGVYDESLLNNDFLLRQSLDETDVFGSNGDLYDCSWKDKLYNVINLFFSVDRAGDFSSDGTHFNVAMPTWHEFQYALIHYDEIVGSGSLPSLEDIKAEAEEKYTWRPMGRTWELVGNLKGPKGDPGPAPAEEVG